MLQTVYIFLLLITTIQLEANPPSGSRPFQKTDLKSHKPSFTQFLASLPEKEKDKILELDWKFPGTYQLIQSKSTLQLPKGYVLLLGEDAKKVFSNICKYHPISGVEAIVQDTTLRTAIHFEYVPCGYCLIEDWKKVSPKDLLKVIAAPMEKANAGARKNGDPEVHVVGWIKEPTVDTEANTAYFAFETEQGGYHMILSTLIKFGRYGFEKLICMTGKENHIYIKRDLDKLIQAYSFDPGYRYEDYEPADALDSRGMVKKPPIADLQPGFWLGFFLLVEKYFSVFIALVGLYCFILKKRYPLGFSFKKYTDF